ASPTAWSRRGVSPLAAWPAFPPARPAARLRSSASPGARRRSRLPLWPSPRITPRSTTCAAPPPIAAPSPPICCAASGPSRPSPSACSMADRGTPRPQARDGAVTQPLPHDSADLHVAGAAAYVDDLPEPPGLLHCAFGHATEGQATLVALDLDAVRAAPGVVAVFTAADITGENNVGPVVHDDRLLADGEILYPGQPLFLLAATSTRAARRAATFGKVIAKPRP